MPELPEGATLMLRLQNGASFTGVLGGSVPAKASVTLDATSKLSSRKRRMSGFVNADLTHANVQSNGFNLYYDSSVAEMPISKGNPSCSPAADSWRRSSNEQPAYAKKSAPSLAFFAGACYNQALKKKQARTGGRGIGTFYLRLHQFFYYSFTSYCYAGFFRRPRNCACSDYFFRYAWTR